VSQGWLPWTVTVTAVDPDNSTSGGELEEALTLVPAGSDEFGLLDGVSNFVLPAAALRGLQFAPPPQAAQNNVTFVANLSNGAPLLAVSRPAAGRVAALNMQPFSSAAAPVTPPCVAGGADEWNPVRSDGAVLVANTCSWAANKPAPIEVGPATGRRLLGVRATLAVRLSVLLQHAVVYVSAAIACCGCFPTFFLT
jgi:hypothetical protein